MGRFETAWMKLTRTVAVVVMALLLAVIVAWFFLLGDANICPQGMTAVSDA